MPTPQVIDEIGFKGSIGESGDAELPLLVYDAMNQDAALGAAFDWLQTNYGSPPTVTIGTRTLVLRHISGAEEIENAYRCVAIFGAFEQKPILQEGESSFSFEIGIQPVRVVVPIGDQLVYKRPSETEQPPAIHLIGDQGIPGEPPAGVEIYEPTHTQSERHILPAGSIDSNYKQAIKSIVGKTNSLAFKGNDAGECLLQSVTGNRRGNSDWEVSFRWAVKENQTNVSYPGGIVIPNKGGWQYVWPRYILAKDDNALTVTRQIRYMVLATVFPSANYLGLGIGV